MSHPPSYTYSMKIETQITQTETPIVTDAAKFAALFHDPTFYAIWKKQQAKRAARSHAARNRRMGIDRS